MAFARSLPKRTVQENIRLDKTSLHVSGEEDATQRHWNHFDQLDALQLAIEAELASRAGYKNIGIGFEAAAYIALNCKSAIMSLLKGSSDVVKYEYRRNIQADLWIGVIGASAQKVEMEGNRNVSGTLPDVLAEIAVLELKEAFPSGRLVLVNASRIYRETCQRAKAADISFG